MRGTVTIDGKIVELKATASTLSKYRSLFGRDLLKDFRKIEKTFKDSGGEDISAEAIEIIAGLTYVMAKQADPTITNNIDDWLDQFEIFPIDGFAQDVVMLWAKSLNAKIELKNV